MKSELIRIGNSHFIRLSEPLVEQCGLKDEVEVRVDQNCLVISPRRRPRRGWAEAFRSAGSSEHDELLLHSVEPNDFDRAEWKW
jgi:antitoxin MazE